MEENGSSILVAIRTRRFQGTPLESQWGLRLGIIKLGKIALLEPLLIKVIIRDGH